MFRPLTAYSLLILSSATFFAVPAPTMAETFTLKLRSVQSTPEAAPEYTVKDAKWDASRTAIIVCDVWDYHHCLNAVRRLEEFAPRLNQLLIESRQRGAIVIHAPSDCMPAYVDHPARLRAVQTPKAKQLPKDIEHWCSRIPTESNALYPIDQSDGGEDDDPQEHASWAAKLMALGRNLGIPWKKQSDLITIESDRDYISDRGDEVWNILEQHGIQNVILTGVHCNMCVLGRPFGLRQMVLNGKQVVLVRDLTDSMYSPKRWPYVDHFTGHDLIINYVEAQICPTITSDQILGGTPFHWKADKRVAVNAPRQQPQTELNFQQHWTSWDATPQQQAALQKYSGTLWHRGALRIPADWAGTDPVNIALPNQGKFQVWLNGQALHARSSASPDVADHVIFAIPTETLIINDYNLLVVKSQHAVGSTLQALPAVVVAGPKRLCIKGGWQVRTGDAPENANIPLPAKFGIGPDAVLQLHGMPSTF